MKAEIRMKCLAVILMIVAAGSTVADGVMKPWATLASEGRATGTAPTNAVSYFDGGNWLSGSIPSGRGVRADLPETVLSESRNDGFRFVMADRHLTLGKLYANRSNFETQAKALQARPFFVSDYGLEIDNDAADGWTQMSLEFAGRLYTEVSSSKRLIFTALTSEFCGDVKMAENTTLYVGTSTTRFRLDLYATDSNPIRTNPIEAAGLGADTSEIVIYAPQGSDAQTGSWNQVAGSPFLFRSSPEAHPLSAGTLVTGAGIPQGTFLKRVFSDSMIELSAPVTDTIAGNAVQFAAFTPQVYQHLGVLGHSKVVSNFGLMKYRPQDVLRVEVDRCGEPCGLTLVAADQQRPGVTSCPGTLVLHDFSAQNYPVVLGTCHLEFAETGTEGLPGGFTNEAAYVSSQTSTSVSRLTVTNGLEAVLTVRGLKGTFVKDGSGTLSLGFNDGLASNTGTLTVEEGAVAVTCNRADAVPSIGTLNLAAGATLRVPVQGLRVDNFNPEQGAVLDGPGVLEVTCTMQDYLSLRAKLVCTGGAALGFRHPAGEVFYEAPAPQVVGNPAFWVDVSKGSTMTYADDGNGVQRVSRMTDVRGEGYPYATAAGSGPELLFDAKGNPQHVYFERVASASEPAQTHALMWNKGISGICSIFKVLNPREGGGQILGGSPFRRDRDSSYGYNSKLLANSVAREDRHPELASAEYLVNGQVIPHTETAISGNPLKLPKAFPYPGGIADTPTTELVPLLAELHVSGGVRYSATDKTDAADNFDSEFNSDHDAGRNGDQRMYECLIYTNELTETEKMQVRGYLMRKWMNAEPNFVRVTDAEIVGGAIVATETQPFGVAEGTKAEVASVSGEGTFVKGGRGQLFVDDLADAQTALEVKGGTLTVRSISLGRDGLPDGAVLHVDAADLGSMTIEAKGSRKRVLEWRDWRGGDYPVLKPVSTASNGLIPQYEKTDASSGYVPTVVNGITIPCSEDELKNKASLLETSGFKFTKGSDDIYTIPDVHSIFGLYFNGQNGKPADQNIIPVGCINGKLPGEDGHTWGFVPSDSKLWNRSEGYTERTLSLANAPGGSLVRLNGVEREPDIRLWYSDANVLSLVAYEEIGASSLFSFRNKDGTWGSGNYCVGEVVLYRTALSRENANRVEAYLQHKWRNVVTSGYRPAVAKSVRVDAGATLDISGSAPITVSSLSCAGSIAGSVALSQDAVISIPVASDGTIPPISISGKIDVSKGGTIRLIGNGVRPISGSHAVLAADSFLAPMNLDAWKFETVGDLRRRSVSLALIDGALVVNVTSPGMGIIVR